jgi:hypothetical protein
MPLEVVPVDSGRCRIGRIEGQVGLARHKGDEGSSGRDRTSIEGADHGDAVVVVVFDVLTATGMVVMIRIKIESLQKGTRNISNIFFGGD